MKFLGGWLLGLLMLWLLVCGEQAWAGELEGELQQSLRAVGSATRAAMDKLVDHQSVAAELAEIQTLAEGVRIIHLLLQGRFQQRSEGLAEMGADAMERHQTVESRYQQRMAEFLVLIEGLPPAESLRPSHLQPLLQLLDTLLPSRQYPILGTLPYQHLRFPASTPVATPTIVPAYRGGDTAVRPADTEGASEVPLSEPVVQLAQSLGWSPVAIYEWVMNNIDSQWYWGSMKGAEETLRQRSGNDADQAALLAALLRASGFPARYVRGVIEFFPGIEQAKSLTGLDDPLKIAAFLQKAGIPFEPVIAGGRIVNFRIEHIWVETEVPYANYRGAVLDEHGKLWIPLDTHLKPAGHNWSAAADLPADFPLSAIRDDYLAAVREETPLEYLRQRVEAQLDTAWEELLRTSSTETHSLGILPPSPQFTALTITGEYTTLPAELCHRVHFLATGDSGRELFSFSIEAARLASRQLLLSYEPETVQDQRLINAYGGLDNTPAYLVRLRPVLLLDGERLVVARDGLPMGADYRLTITLSSPAGSAETNGQHVVGNLTAIAIACQQVVPPVELPLEEKDAAWLLFEAALSYIERWNTAEDELAALLKLAHLRPLPTVVTVGGVIEVDYLFDTPHGFDWKGLFIDAGLRRVEVIAQAGQQERERQFMRLSALQGSILENRLFEEHFQVESVSTAKLLALAQQAPLPLLTLDSSNIDALLPPLDLAGNVKADIRNAVHQGFNVTLPEEEVPYRSWRGIAYLKENMATGEAGYMLSGMIAGGMTAEEWADTYLRDVLQTPYGDPPNQDAQSAAHIAKISAGDRQNGTVGRPVETPLAVLVTDLKGRPVVGAAVTFTRLAAGANAKGETFTASTGANGIAKVWPTLGLATGDNPSFQRVNQGDVHATQVGVNLFTATVASRFGELAIPQPFQVYARPEAPDKIVHLLGDKNKSLANNPAGTLKVRVVDRHGNPVSNIPVSFTAQGAVSREALMPLPPGYRGIEFYLKDDCPAPYPLYGDCPSISSILRMTGHHGAGVETLLGNTVNTEYTVAVSAPGLPTESYTLATYGYMKPGDYLAPELFIGQLATVNERGELVNAAKAGADLQAPLTAALFMLSNGYGTEKYTCGADEEDKPIYCWRLKGDGIVETARITGDATVIFIAKAGNGQAAPTQTGGDGLYRSTYTTGAQPALNVIEAVGEATLKDIPEVYYDAWGNAVMDGYGSATLPLRTVTVKSGQRLLFDRTSKEPMPNANPQKTTYAVYGVNVPTAVAPGLVLLGDGGMARHNVTIDYTIEPAGAAPAGYDALGAQVDLFEDNGAWAGYLVGSATAGSGQAIFSHGTIFDPKKRYLAQTVLNRGSAIEIRSDKVPINTLLADLDIDSDNNAGTGEDGTHRDPSRNPLEEQVEDLAGHPGKVIKPNLLDVTGNKVPGFADGIDVHGNEGDGRSAPFVPVIVELAGSALDPATATIRFAYPGSDPAKVQKSTDANGEARYTPAPGSLRLWSKDGGYSRKAADIAQGGDYITSGTPYTLDQLAPAAIDGGWRLYLEGLTASNGTGDQRIVIHIDPDGDGPLPAIEGDAVRATVFLAALIPDYNRNRQIDEEDRQRAARGDTFYFWINDDDDEGETEGDDIPLEKGWIISKRDCDNSRIDGVRDLIDFFPVALEVKLLLQAFPPNHYTYRLKSAAENLNIVFPDLEQATVGDYLTDVDTARRVAALTPYPVRKNGVVGYGLITDAPQKFNALMKRSHAQDINEVILLEGSGKGKEPLVMEVLNEAGQQVYTASLNLSIDGVEQMFRHLNLIAPEGGPPAGSEHGGPANRFLGLSSEDKEPANFPLSEVDPLQHFVFLHGYNVSGQQARGWHSEMFKRLYWSGSRSQFWGVSWYGFETQGWKPGSGNFTPNFHLNITNALNTARRLNEMLPLLIKKGDITLAAHSLGNAVTISLLSDHYTNPQNPSWVTWEDTQARITDVFMINAALALEALDGGMPKNQHMYHPGWWNYQEQNAKYNPGLWSSEWHRLFEGDQNDNRRGLTWRDRFADFCPPHVSCYNFFSSGEEVLATQEEDGILFDVPTLLDGLTGRYSFVLQERLKGEVDLRRPWVGMDGSPAWKSMLVYVAGSPYGGWGFNRDYEITENVLEGVISYMLPPEEADALYQGNKEQLKTLPFFKMGPQFGELFDPSAGSSYAQNHRDRLLAKAFPVLTLPAGGPGGGALGQKIDVFDMQNHFKKGWPRQREAWLHTDVREIPYINIYKLFNFLVNKEEDHED